MASFYLVISFFLCLWYAWVMYNVPILAVGVKRMRRVDRAAEKELSPRESLPVMSIVIPVRNEEKVIARLLKSLLRLNYPIDKREIIIVEDASTDRTPEICRTFAEQHPRCIKFFHRPISKGKPSALNFGFRHAQGDIVAVFDADNVPERNVLLKAVRYFDDLSVAAVQGTTRVINSDENMLTKFISYEEAVWLRDYLQGKDALNLFVPMTGSCQFIRKNVAEKVGNWDEDCLTEDIEMSARITKKGYTVRYAPEIISWQEAPSSLGQLIKQRMRWFRGYMEVAIRYGSFLNKLEKRSIDAEITLIGPYMLTLFLASNVVSMHTLFLPVLADPTFATLSTLNLLLTTVTLLVVGIALIWATKPRNLRNLLWLPFIYVYLSLQSTLATYALVQIMFKRPKTWTRTPKTGSCTEQKVTELRDAQDIDRSPVFSS